KTESRGQARGAFASGKPRRKESAGGDRRDGARAAGEVRSEGPGGRRRAEILPVYGFAPVSDRVHGEHGGQGRDPDGARQSDRRAEGVQQQGSRRQASGRAAWALRRFSEEIVALERHHVGSARRIVPVVRMPDGSEPAADGPA